MKIMPDKIASSVSYCTSGALVCGGAVAQWIHSIDWNLVAIFSGMLIGMATFFVNWYFSNKRTKAYVEATEAYKQALGRGVVQSPPEAK